MRCLILAPEGAPTSVVESLVREHGLIPVRSSDLAAGAALAAIDLGRVTCAVAVLPFSSDLDGLARGVTAILVEIGVVVGVGIPTLLVAETAGAVPPALDTLAHVTTDLNNRDTLRLHLGVFIRLALEKHRPSSESAQRSEGLALGELETLRRRLREVLDESGPTAAFAFERFVTDLLSRFAGQSESNIPREDEGVDAVVGFGGPAGPLIAVVEAKKLSRSSASSVALTQTANQLLKYMESRRADLGLIVADVPVTAATKEAMPPFILALSADELLDLLGKESLERILRRARNRAVHGV